MKDVTHQVVVLGLLISLMLSSSSMVKSSAFVMVKTTTRASSSSSSSSLLKCHNHNTLGSMRRSLSLSSSSSSSSSFGHVVSSFSQKHATKLLQHNNNNVKIFRTGCHHHHPLTSSTLSSSCDRFLRYRKSSSSSNSRTLITATSTDGDGDNVVNNDEMKTIRRSVTGSVYSPPLNSDDVDSSYPVVRLFTKEGCTLCDKVTEVLQSLRDSHPHALEAVDITDDDKTEWYSKYKYDIPVLHVDGVYWTKHRITEAEAREGLSSAQMGTFTVRKGEPDAGAMERRQAERNNK